MFLKDEYNFWVSASSILKLVVAYVTSLLILKQNFE